MKVRTQYSVLQRNVQSKSWNQYSVLCYETEYCYPSIKKYEICKQNEIVISL